MKATGSLWIKALVFSSVIMAHSAVLQFVQAQNQNPDPNAAQAQISVSKPAGGGVSLTWSTENADPDTSPLKVEILKSTDVTSTDSNWTRFPADNEDGLFGLNGSLDVAEIADGVPGFFRIRLVDPNAGPVRASLVSATLIKTYTTQEILALISEFTNGLSATFPLAINNGVSAWNIVYKTPDLQGNLIDASGVVFIPDGVENPAATVSYQHGKLFNKEDAPSLGTTPEFTVGLFMGGNGYVCVMADYLGFGASAQLLHPYLHAETEASSCVDMILAAREFQGDHGLPTADRLFLTGYSQGGHSTMALHREIDLNFSDRLTVTASSPMAGPHSVSQVMFDRMTSNQPYPNPFYLVFIVFSYNEAYGLFDDPGEYFREPYATTLRNLLAADAPEDQINDFLPGQASIIFREDVFNEFKSNPDHPLRLALAANDTFTGDWLPEAPIRMYHCTSDEVVPYQNSVVARDALLARVGAGADIRVQDPRLLPFFQDGSHTGCVTWALVALQGWVEDLL